jgi:acyl-CoA reductase-like NAD-dependent aldehyde dehydrogenase
VEDRTHIYVGGKWVRPTGKVIEVIRPSTEEPLARVTAAGTADIEAAVVAAREAFDNGPWPHLDPSERLGAVRRLAEIYGQRRAELADLITAELGAPISFARRAQVSLPWSMMGALADIAAGYQWQEERVGFYGQPVRVTKQPVGVVAAVLPWNMPQFLTVTKVVPALLAGCTVVIKPAPEAALDALFLADIFHEIGLPAGVVNVVPAGREAGAQLVAHQGLDKVSFTGSSEAGRQVAAACARQLTKVTLELGGKSAAIVLADADPEHVASAVRLSGMGMAGQICNALTRVIVPAAQAQRFTEALRAELASINLGDPADPSVEMGPLVSRRQQERVHDYIEVGRKEGARLVIGGNQLPAGIDKGWYVQPTLFDADNGMTIAREEIFGPVLVVIPYRDEDEAIALANANQYGLAGSVFTNDVEHGLKIAGRVRTGTFGINEGYSMDPVAPFGGVKGSGHGRELGHEGLESYLDLRSISIAAR